MPPRKNWPRERIAGLGRTAPLRLLRRAEPDSRPVRNALGRPKSGPAWAYPCQRIETRSALADDGVASPVPNCRERPRHQVGHLGLDSRVRPCGRDRFGKLGGPAHAFELLTAQFLAQLANSSF